MSALRLVDALPKFWRETRAGIRLSSVLRRTEVCRNGAANELPITWSSGGYLDETNPWLFMRSVTHAHAQPVWPMISTAVVLSMSWEPLGAAGWVDERSHGHRLECGHSWLHPAMRALHHTSRAQIPTPLVVVPVTEIPLIKHVF